MASLLLGYPNTLPDGTGLSGRKKKIPKVAVYVAGAAFAVTTGLTLLVLPYVRQAAKMQNPTQFMSHRNLAILSSRKRMPKAGPSTVPSLPASSSNMAQTAAGPAVHALSTVDEVRSRSGSSKIHANVLDVASISTDLLRDRSFNDREERSLYGVTPSSESDGEDHGPTSALLGFKALGIATALVFGSAGLGALIVAKMMGVGDMSEFTSRMRENLQSSMPSLISSVNKPGRSSDGFDGQAIEQWVAKIEADDAEEEAREEALLAEGGRRPS
ncbi:hypothetical protein IAR55_003740 [Kwoniella newhampshirensis]|uniref:Transmembrane protein 242 n=1 Tax=Kwoniella newhampshirensis TaxID=1651941 RepID=A0AAW0YXF6_9TREE